MQLLPGLYQLGGSPFGQHQNSYLLRHGGATVLIDSGDMQGDSLPVIERTLARWGIRTDEITHLFVTHEHIDHASHAALWQRRGVKVVASPAAAEAMAAGDERCIGYAVGRTFEPCVVDTVLGDGQSLQVGELEWRALAAPGHCAGMTVFEVMLSGERLWFTGDLFEAVHAHRLIGLNLAKAKILSNSHEQFMSSAAAARAYLA